MSVRLVAAVLVAGTLLTVGCSGDDTTATDVGSPATTTGSGAATTAPEGLPGTSWVLATVEGTPAAEGATATLDFSEGDTLAGTTGCNSFEGTYETASDALTIVLGPMTLIGCTDAAVATQETALTQGLPEVGGFTIDGTTLTLTSDDGTAVFTYTAGISELAGTMWQVTGVNNGNDAVESSALTEALTAEFGTDGVFSGAGGCNQLSGPYVEVDAKVVAIGPLLSTQMACDPEVSALEMQYVTALESVTTYELSGGNLTLRDGQGSMQVTAIPAG